MSKITFDDAKNIGEAKRRMILENFGEEDFMAKSISSEEFNKVSSILTRAVDAEEEDA